MHEVVGALAQKLPELLSVGDMQWPEMYHEDVCAESLGFFRPSAPLFPAAYIRMDPKTWSAFQHLENPTFDTPAIQGSYEV
jgi:hypothetical protein